MTYRSATASLTTEFQRVLKHATILRILSVPEQDLSGTQTVPEEQWQVRNNYYSRPASLAWTPQQRGLWRSDSGGGLFMV